MKVILVKRKEGKCPVCGRITIIYTYRIIEGRTRFVFEGKACFNCIVERYQKRGKILSRVG